MRILIVEDEEHLAFGLRFNFEAEGFDVTSVADGGSGLELFRDADPPFDLVILDLMLPGKSGYDICVEIRESNPNVAILVLSARTLPEDKARAFDCGCDQYMTKPFDLAELLSRVRNLVDRRGRTRPVGEIVTFGDAQVDFRTFRVRVADRECKLTPTELQLLKLFVRNQGAVLSRSEILERVWGIDSAPTTRTVDNFVMRLRKHFEKDPAQPRHFLSVRGAGYRFVAEPGDDVNDLTG